MVGDTTGQTERKREKNLHTGTRRKNSCGGNEASGFALREEQKLGKTTRRGGGGSNGGGLRFAAGLHRVLARA